MNSATNKSKAGALNSIQSNQIEGHPISLLSRILDLETVAAGALAQLRKKEADDIAAADSAAKAAVIAPVETIESLSAKLAALQASQAANAA